MHINSDINILGGLPDWNLINVFIKENMLSIQSKGGIHSFTAIKTDKSVKRFEKAITATLLHFRNKDIEQLFKSIIQAENISADTLLFLFWNASDNNELFYYLNENVFFPAFYSGRVTVRKEEAEACLKELKQSENDLKKWSESTINLTASKYLTLLKKFGLMVGRQQKAIRHPHLTDKMFVYFIYWLVAASESSNLLNSKWFRYSFIEKQTFIDRLMQKRFSKFYNVVYTGDRLNIEPLISYNEIYQNVIKS